MAKFKKRMRKWFNVDGSAADTSTVYDADYADDDDDFNDDLTIEDTAADDSIAGRLRRLRRAIDPDGKPKENFADEVKELADMVGASLPAGSTKIGEQITAVEDFYFGKDKAEKKRKNGRSVPDLVDRMVRDMKITVAPDAALGQKLESVERNLGKDAAAQAAKSLRDRVAECYIDIYGDPRG